MCPKLLSDRRPVQRDGRVPDRASARRPTASPFTLQLKGSAMPGCTQKRSRSDSRSRSENLGLSAGCGGIVTRQCNRRGINVRAQRNAIDDGVARVPPSSWAHAIEEHLDSEAKPFLHFAAANQSLSLCAFQRNQGHRCRHHPTHGVRNPRPTVLRWIKRSNRICRSESLNFKRTSHEASSGRQLAKLSSAPMNVCGAAPKIIRVLAAMVLAQKLTPTVPFPTAGHSPFGR
jgi:hypothetical protein